MTIANTRELPAWWYDQAACRPEVSTLDVTAWVPLDDSLEAELRAAARAAADNVGPGHPLYPSYFAGIDTGTNQPTDEARTLCLLCPSVVPCLERSLDVPEKQGYGLAGGCGEAERRLLRAARITSDCSTFDDECACEYCSKVREFTTPASPGTVRDRNGPNARCGYLSTYSRGHRDPACSWAQAMTSREARMMEGSDDDAKQRADVNGLQIRTPHVGCDHASDQCVFCAFLALVNE